MIDYSSRFKEVKEQCLLERQLLNGQKSPVTEEEESERIMGLDAETMEDLVPSRHGSDVQDVSIDPFEDSKPELLDVGEVEREEDSERSRSIDETSHKTRSKRESRRMRELEQAKFSLELLKVRSTSAGGPLSEDSVPGSTQSQLENHHQHSPRGSPASHGSFELLSMEDMETEGSGCLLVHQEHARLGTFQPEIEPLHEGLRDSNFNEKPMLGSPNKEEVRRATFYIASNQSPVHEPKFESPSKPCKERKESTSRRPVVVLISMQKESPLDEEEPQAVQPQGRVPYTGSNSSSSRLTSIAGLEVGSEKEQSLKTVTQAKRDSSGVDRSSKVPSPATHGATSDSQGICSSGVDIQITLEPKAPVPMALPSQQERKASRPTQEAPSPILDTKPPKAQKKSSAQTVIVNMMEKPSNTVFSPPRRKLPFSK